jgi:tetratricopeptide (TPR) repeat protein
MKNIIKIIRSSLIIIIVSISFSVFIYGQSDNHLKRAISAMETGLFEESLKQLNYALNDDPKNAQVHKLRALLFEALEKKEKAIKAWNDCIRYSKDQSMIQEAKIHLNHLNGI